MPKVSIPGPPKCIQIGIFGMKKSGNPACDTKKSNACCIGQEQQNPISRVVGSGTDVIMILKIFSPKNFAKELAFFAQNKAKLCKNWIITLGFEKNANFSAKNWQKSQKIVIITSTPDLTISAKKRWIVYVRDFTKKLYTALLQGLL
jgi:hypothetical protein